MKFTCLQENLKQGLNIIERIVGKNPSLPILSTILIETQKNLIKLCATDLEVGISCWINASVEKEGSVCIPARILSSYINSLPNKKIEINSKDNKLNLKCENYRSVITGFSVEDFPIIPQIKEKEFISLNSFSFCNGLSKVIGAVAVSESRPEISGVFINFKKEFIKLVATDSFRLSENTISVGKKLEIEKSMIIPAKTMQEVIRIFSQSDEKGSLDIYSSPNQILFLKNDYPKIQLISRLIEGGYPNYEEIIPNDFLTKVIFDKDELIRHIKIASLFASKTNEMKVKVNPSEKNVEFLSSNPDAGENKSEISAQIEGEKTEVTFNCKYLMDGLSNIDEDQIVLELNGEERPGVLRPGKNKNYLYIVMPIRPL